MFKSSGLAFFVWMTVGCAAWANDSNQCHNLVDGAARLTCYDQQTGFGDADRQTPDPGTSVVSPDGDHWRLTSDISALEDRKDIWLSVRSQNTEPNVIGSSTYATLWVRCMENKTNVFVGFNRYTTDNQSVRYKFDDGQIQKQWMITMRGGEGIGIWSGGKAIPFIRNMFGRGDMVMAYDTYSGPVEFVFNIAGLQQRIDPLAEECGWTP